MKIPEFDLEKYNSSDKEQYKIKMLSEYLIEYLKKNSSNYNLDDIVLFDDSQLEDLYFESRSWIWSGFLDKYGGNKIGAVQPVIIYTGKLPHKDYKTEDEINEQIKSNERKLQLQKEVTKKLLWVDEYLYNKNVDNYWKPLERKKLGYKVFVAFKRLISERREVKSYKVDNSESLIPFHSNEEKKLELLREIQNLAIEAFLGDTETFELFKYLSENFVGSGARFTELTKYNQIYIFLDYAETLSKEPYKNLVSKVYGFNYGKSEIKGETKKHQITLSNLEKRFKELKRN